MRSKIVISIVISIIIVATGFFFFSHDLKGTLNGLTGYISQKQAIFNKKPPDEQISKIEHAILTKLKELESSEPVTSHSDSVTTIQTSIPRGKPLSIIIWQLSSVVSATSYKVSDCIVDPAGEKCVLVFRRSFPADKRIIVSIILSSTFFSKTAKMGIVIENFGFKADRKSIDYLSFPEPLTLCIIPSAKLTAWTAEITNEYKKEIIMQLPMEPLPAGFRKSANQSGFIMIDYPENRIRRILDNAFESVLPCAGMMNYSGKRALEDTRIMTILLNRLSRENKYFIEMPSGQRSVAAALSKKLKVPYGSVDIVVDNTANDQKIRETLVQAGFLAQQRGTIIFSSPPTESFIKILEEELPNLKKNGIHLVPISTIISERSTKSQN